MKLLLHNHITVRDRHHSCGLSPARLSGERREKRIYNKGVSLAAFASFMCAAALLFASCAQIEDDLTDCPADASPDSSYSASRISFRFKTSTDDTTKATATPGPTGGEPTVYEAAESYEYGVKDIIVFLYVDGDGKGINGNDSEAVTPIYFGNGDLDASNSGPDITNDNIDYICTTQQTTANVATAKYNVLAVVNPSAAFVSGLKTGDDFNDLTVSGLRDYMYFTNTAGKAWEEDTTDSSATGYSNFAMSSVKEDDDSVLDLTSSTGDETVATITVQRLAARVDYKLGSDFSNSTYTMPEGNAYAGATVTITGTALVNDLTSGSYLFKRVTDPDNPYASSVTPDLSSGVIKYLGEEKISTTDGKVTSGNYVIDPWTAGKDGETNLNNIIASSTALSYGNYYPNAPTDVLATPSDWGTLINTDKKKQTTFNDGYTRIGYTLENTVFAPNTSKLYSSGVVFQATFTPKFSDVDKGYSALTELSGGTFFKYNDVLYATLEDVVASVWGNELVGKALSASTWTGLGFDDADDFESSCPEDPIGYKEYLLEEGNNFLSLTAYMSTILGYSRSGSVALNGNSTNTYSALSSASSDQVTVYENGTCYYIWWIRHSNDNDDTSNGIMEYCVVRNNVYKLDVASVSTIGGAVPTDGLLINVYVKPWTKIQEETLKM